MKKSIRKILLLLSILLYCNYLFSQIISDTFLLKPMFISERIFLKKPYKVSFFKKIEYYDGSYSAKTYRFITDSATAYKLLNKEIIIKETLPDGFFFEYDLKYDYGLHGKITKYSIDYHFSDIFGDRIYSEGKDICIIRYNDSIVGFDVVFIKRGLVEITYNGFFENFHQPYYLMLKYVIPEKKKFKINIFKK
jgi:hypothetical protein